VLLNLIVNAMQWSPDESRIRLYTYSTEQHLSIRICDHGPGIQAENPQQVFDPFFSQREGGIGLGLTVAQQIVLAHDGTIKAFNHEQGGACFQISLPFDRTHNPKT
jgi:K+-sensing histidine kinase KdpD